MYHPTCNLALTRALHQERLDRADAANAARWARRRAPSARRRRRLRIPVHALHQLLRRRPAGAG
jgi:hypothetical protein